MKAIEFAPYSQEAKWARCCTIGRVEISPYGVVDHVEDSYVDGVENCTVYFAEGE